MKVTYLEHSGFAVEYKNYVLIFDWYKGKVPEFDVTKKVYVFSSHAHYDHFNQNIFTWKEDYPDIHYILSADIVTDTEGAKVTYVVANQEYQVDDLKVQTLHSTDEGVAFVVYAEDKVIYHAGDLNWWHWEEEDDAYNRMMRGDYQKEIETLAGEKIDLAFVVLDPRQEEQFYWGFDWYMRHTDTKIVFPMHMWKQYEVQDRLIGMEVSEPYREKIMRIREMGQVFEL